MTIPAVPTSGSEVQALLDAERSERPFVAFRDGEGVQVLRLLDSERPLLTIGRHSSCDVSLAWDDKVSRTHAVLERLADAWTLADDGISRNGTFVNGARLASRHRLVDRDVIRLGGSRLTFRNPQEASLGITRLDDSIIIAALTPAQRKVLIALCRPFKDGNCFATPASNSEIADELVLSVDAVKTHMRGLFERFGVGDLPQNQKRAKVAELALQTALVTSQDL